VTTIRHIVSRGRVQGVGYRAFVAEQAMALDLEGWVRNRRDGTVEAVFAGSDAAVAGVIAACRRGPYGARVDAVDERDGEAEALTLRRPGEAFSVLATV
jgi:acylphosphatase